MSRDPAPGAAPVVEVLDDVHGWRIGSQGLVRVDLTTGVVTPGVFPDNPLDTSVDLDKIDNGGWSQDPAGDPIVADTPAGRLALAAFPITVPGRGTTPGGIAVELVGADVATGQKTLTTLVPLPAGDTPGFHPDITYVGVIGVRAATAVLTVHTNEYALTAAVDLTSRQAARAPKPSRPGPGHPPGSRNRHTATSYDVGKTVKRDRTITARRQRTG